MKGDSREKKNQRKIGKVNIPQEITLQEINIYLQVNN